jgi:hypothetical protein
LGAGPFPGLHVSQSEDLIKQVPSPSLHILDEPISIFHTTACHDDHLLQIHWRMKRKLCLASTRSACSLPSAALPSIASYQLQSRICSSSLPRFKQFNAGGCMRCKSHFRQCPGPHRVADRGPHHLLTLILIVYYARMTCMVGSVTELDCLSGRSARQRWSE